MKQKASGFIINAEKSFIAEDTLEYVGFKINMHKETKYNTFTR